MLSPTSSRKRSSRSIASDQSRPAVKRQQRNSPYVSQGSACCSICQDTAVQLVQLGACCHGICLGCMTSHLLHAFKLVRLPLRCPMPHCRARLGLQSAVQLMEQQAPGSKALAAKVLLAGADPLTLMGADSCFSCPYPDCQVPLELDVQLPDCPSDCPACSRPVCGTCRSKWHAGLSCAQYQSLGRSSSTPTPPQVITATADAWQYQQMMQYHLGAVQQQQQQSGSPLHHRLVQFHPHSQLSVDVVGGPCKDQQQQQQSVVLGQSDVDSMAWSPAKQTSGS